MNRASLICSKVYKSVVLNTLLTVNPCSTSSVDSSGNLSVETASEPDVENGIKSKGGGIDVGFESQPVTFSHRYSEKAPSARKKQITDSYT